MSNASRHQNDLEGLRVCLGASRTRGLDPADRAFVDAQRAKGTSWSNIAKMLGRSELDIRKACEPADVVVMFCEAATVWTPRTDHDVVLAQLEICASNTADIRAATKLPAHTVSYVLSILKAKDRAERVDRIWSITPAGQARLANRREASK